MGNRHSDKEKFCNDLNGPKAPKMSERPLKTLQDFPTSKLNTTLRCLLPSAAVHAAVSNNNLRRLGFKPTKRTAQTYAGSVRTAVLGKFEDAA
jgi:hypothetical protein